MVIRVFLGSPVSQVPTEARIMGSRPSYTSLGPFPVVFPVRLRFLR